MTPIEIMMRALKEVDDRPILLTPVAEHLLGALHDAGYVIVPVEMTEEIYMAMCDADDCEWKGDAPPDQYYARLYKAMLETAQSLSAVRNEVLEEATAAADMHGALSSEQINAIRAMKTEADNETD